MKDFNQKKPLVSVYIPTHNRSKLLERAITSVLNQSYKNVELIISDDGSTDNTEEVVKKIILENDGRTIKYFKFGKPNGACAARNVAINNASGYYITGLDDDDFFSPNRIELFVDLYQLNKYSYLCTDVALINDDDDIVYPPELEMEILPEMLFNRNYIGNQVFTKTEYLKSIHGFDEKAPAWQDYDTWIRLSQKYGVGYKMKTTTYYLYESSVIKRITTSSKAYDGFVYFLNKHSSLFSKSNIKELKVRDIINRKCLFSFRDFLTLCTVNNFLVILKHNLKIKFPMLLKFKRGVL